jgi:hypothetical protein
MNPMSVTACAASGPPPGFPGTIQAVLGEPVRFAFGVRRPGARRLETRDKDPAMPHRFARSVALTGPTTVLLVLLAVLANVSFMRLASGDQPISEAVPHSERPPGTAVQRSEPSPPLDPAADYLPNVLKLSWRNLAPNAHMASAMVEWDGKALRYETVRSSSVKATNIEKRSITPSASVWKEFWTRLDREKVWAWRAEYPRRSEATKGYEWSLAIVRGTKQVTSRGLNAYPSWGGDVTQVTEQPDALHRLWHAVDRLVGRPTEVEGSYFAGFEASVLTAETPAYRGQRWWLEGNMDFREGYAKFSSRDETKSRFKTFKMARPTIWVRLRGRLVGPGGYGHMNAYEYEFIVEEVIEMKPSKGFPESAPPPRR